MRIDSTGDGEKVQPVSSGGLKQKSPDVVTKFFEQAVQRTGSPFKKRDGMHVRQLTQLDANNSDKTSETAFKTQSVTGARQKPEHSPDLQEKPNTG